MNANQPEPEQARSGEQPKGTAWELYTWLREIVFCIGIITIFFVFFIRLVSVSGSSMVPTLTHGDKVALVSNFIAQDYDQGDIVVLLQRDYKNEPLIKRVIATAGQTVDIDFDNGVVYVDGEALQEDYVNAPIHLRGDQEYPLTVPENCIFVLGDNRNESADSRFAAIGVIDIRKVMGEVKCVVLPFKHIGKPDMGIWAEKQ